MSGHDTTLEAAAAASAVASKFMYGGAGASLTGFAISNELLGLLGLGIALAGFFVNVYYRRKQDRREEMLRQWQMRDRP